MYNYFIHVTLIMEATVKFMITIYTHTYTQTRAQEYTHIYIYIHVCV